MYPYIFRTFHEITTFYPTDLITVCYYRGNTEQKCKYLYSDHSRITTRVLNLFGKIRPYHYSIKLLTHSTPKQIISGKVSYACNSDGYIKGFSSTIILNSGIY